MLDTAQLRLALSVGSLARRTAYILRRGVVCAYTKPL